MFGKPVDKIWMNKIAIELLLNDKKRVRIRDEFTPKISRAFFLKLVFEGCGLHGCLLRKQSNFDGNFGFFVN